MRRTGFDRIVRLTAFVSSLGSVLLSTSVRANDTRVACVILNAGQEVPTNASTATGTGTVAVDTKNNVLHFDISYSGLSSAETAAHIHGPAARGMNAGVLFTLPSGAHKVGDWNYPSNLEADILNGLTYVNVHSVTFGGGEIRGQIEPEAPYQPVAADSVCNPADLIGAKWPFPLVEVIFNESLDPALDGAANTPFIVGTAAKRKACFLKAVADWNAVFEKINSGFRIRPRVDCGGPPDFCHDEWAGDQNPLKCPERDSTGEFTNSNVYGIDYDTNHHPDGKKVVSTGHNHGNVHKDSTGVNALPPGWILETELVAPPSMGPIETELLGQTRYSENANHDLTEADIVWFTHFEKTIPACRRIEWDYSCPDACCGKQKLPGPNYDFYSVVLHELGHLLGLDHFQHGDPECHNVMFGTLERGERQVISSKEEACLVRLYGGPAGVGTGLPSIGFAIRSVRPNPSSSGVGIDFTLDRAANVRVEIFDLGGQRVRTLWNGLRWAGPSSVHWDGLTSDGARVAPGSYYVRLSSGRQSRTYRFVMLK
jgi:hypothetical protein